MTLKNLSIKWELSVNFHGLIVGIFHQGRGEFKLKKKEPIKNWKMWIVLVILFAFCVPWYFPAGTYEPIIFGVPYWVLAVLGASVAVSIALTYILKNCWQMTDEEEDEE